MKFYFSVLTTFILAHTMEGKAQTLLPVFEAIQVENRVQLNFTISAGNTCNGIQIFRSPDAVNFIEIGDIQGVCGSSDRSESYFFIDQAPLKNKTNYYRLQLGTLGSSE